MVRIGPHWPTVATRILIRKLSFLSKLLSGSKDTISRRVFTSLAMENIYEISIVQQCRMLEANICTSILAKCLSDPENAPKIVKNSKRCILNTDFEILPFSTIDWCGSAAAAARVANHTSWCRLWDIALDHGVKGTRAMQAIFRKLCRPSSYFQCSLCDAAVSPTSSCLERVCSYQPSKRNGEPFL